MQTTHEQTLGLWILAIAVLVTIAIPLEHSGVLGLAFLVAIGSGLWYGTVKAKASDL